MTRIMRNQRDGLGKYRVWDNRKSRWVENDEPNGRNEHFVIMLKDAYARAALLAYADAVMKDGNAGYAEDIMELANRAGPMHPSCKRPD